MKNILIIDDASYIIESLKFFLTQKGLNIHSACDGQNALDILENNPIDVILTDLNMPNMDGFEMTRKIRSNPNHKKLPIIAYTGYVDSIHLAQANEAGVTEILTKPLTVEAVFKVIKKYLKKISGPI